MTQAEVAEKLGYVDQAYVGKVERGLENPTLSACEKFLAVVGATIRISAD
jgi:transcriptional regulator with XRE-family HTH domain